MSPSSAGHVGGGAERRLDHGDVEAVDEVVAVAHEVLVRLDGDGDVQVAGAPAVGAGAALARQAQALPVGDARRHLDGHGARLAQAAGAQARLARLLDDGALAAAHVAGAGTDELPEPAEAGDLAHAAAAVALRALLAAGAGLGAAAGAGLARRVGRDLDVLGDAEDRLGEGEVEARLDVVAARRGRAAARRAPHPAGVAQHRVEHAAAEEDVEEVAEADVLEVGHLPAAQAVEPVVVVGGARVGVAEDLVGLRRLLELRLGLRVLLVHVRVDLARELAEGLLDLAGVGVTPHAEHVVVVTLQWSAPVGGGHQMSSRYALRPSAVARTVEITRW